MFLNTSDFFSSINRNENVFVNPLETYQIHNPVMDYKQHSQTIDPPMIKPIKKSEHIKIPMNAFMVWAKINRKIMASQYPNFSNLEISKLLGKAWNEMNPEQRKPFINEAKQLRIEHLNQYPEFRYQPRRRHRKNNKKPKPVKTDIKPNVNTYTNVLKEMDYQDSMGLFDHYDSTKTVPRNYPQYEAGPFNNSYDNGMFNDYFDSSSHNSAYQPFDHNLPSISSLVYGANPFYFNVKDDKTQGSFNYSDEFLFF